LTEKFGRKIFLRFLLSGDDFQNGFSGEKIFWKYGTFENCGGMHFNFCCVNTMEFLQGHFFPPVLLGEKFSGNMVPYFLGSIFWGKIFSTNCSAHIAKNPRGPRARGFRGGVVRGYSLGFKRKAPGVCGNSLRGHILALLIHGNCT
jgi:hypothetical protein